MLLRTAASVDAGQQKAMADGMRTERQAIAGLVAELSA